MIIIDSQIQPFWIIFFKFRVHMTRLRTLQVLKANRAGIHDLPDAMLVRGHCKRQKSSHSVYNQIFMVQGDGLQPTLFNF